MSATLPPPGSVWRQRESQRQMRVIYSAECEVIAHDAEMSGHYPSNIPIRSWIGTADAFAAQFIPGDEDYPKTAA